MKIAYLILAHKNSKQLEILIQNLQGSNITIYIHIDAKSGLQLSESFDYDSIESEVYFLEGSYYITWGGFSITQAMLGLMNTCRKNGKYDYISIISGQDFPLLSQDQICSFLTENKGKEFVQYHKIPYNKWRNGGEDRFRYFWLVDELGFNGAISFVEQQRLENISRTFPSSLQPFGGSNWLTITYELMEYVCNFIEENSRSIFNFFKYTLFADELFIQSIILNSPFRENVVNDNLRYVSWVSTNDMETPKIFCEEDYEELIKSDCHFARKFDINIDVNIIKRLVLKIKQS